MDTTIVTATLGVIYMTVIAKQGAVAFVECGNSSSVTISLTCSNNKMIHVISESYSKDCSGETCHTKPTNCNKVLNTNTEGLIVNCNGKQNCTEVIEASTDCIPLDAFAIEYACVEGSMAICIPVKTSLHGSVYLHSPGFPNSTGVNGSCHCEITGSQMMVIMAERRAKPGVITLTTDNKTWLSNFTNYNKVIANGTVSVTLNYMNDDRSGENVWMKVSDAGQMNVSCWRGNASLAAVDADPAPASAVHHNTTLLLSTKADTGTIKVRCSTGKEMDSLTTADNGPTSTQSPGTYHHTASLLSTNTEVQDDNTQSSSLPAVTATLPASVSTPSTQSSSSDDSGRSSTSVSPTRSAFTTSNPTNMESSRTEPGTVTSSQVISTRIQTMMTFTTIKSTSNYSNLPIQVISVSGAAGGILLDVIVVVIVVLCRRLNKSNDRNTLEDSEWLNLDSLQRTRNCEPNNSFEGRIYFELDSKFVNGKDCTESSTDAAASVPTGPEVSPQTDRDEVIRYISHPLPKKPSTPKRMIQGKHDDDSTEGMVVNDLYHSFKPDPIYDVRGEKHKSVGSVEGNLQVQMNDNDMYDHIVRSQKDCVREEPVVGSYEEIKEEDLCVSQEAKRSVCMERPSAYDELKLHTQKDWVNEEHAVGNYEEIMNENVCVSQEAKRSIHMQRPSAYDELKLHTQKEWASDKPAVGNYDTIEDKDLCVSPEEKRFIPFQRPSAYDELKLRTQKDFIREEHAEGNYDKIKDKDLCVSPEGKRSIFMQRSSTYDELKLHTQKD